MRRQVKYKACVKNKVPIIQRIAETRFSKASSRSITISTNKTNYFRMQRLS